VAAPVFVHPGYGQDAASVPAQVDSGGAQFGTQGPEVGAQPGFDPGVGAGSPGPYAGVAPAYHGVPAAPGPQGQAGSDAASAAERGFQAGTGPGGAVPDHAAAPAGAPAPESAYQSGSFDPSRPPGSAFAPAVGALAGASAPPGLQPVAAPSVPGVQAAAGVQAVPGLQPVAAPSAPGAQAVPGAQAAPGVAPVPAVPAVRVEPSGQPPFEALIGGDAPAPAPAPMPDWQSFGGRPGVQGDHELVGPVPGADARASFQPTARPDLPAARPPEAARAADEAPVAVPAYQARSGPVGEIQPVSLLDPPMAPPVPAGRQMGNPTGPSLGSAAYWAAPPDSSRCH
jgi:hypothetical protein